MKGLGCRAWNGLWAEGPLSIGTACTPGCPHVLANSTRPLPPLGSPILQLTGNPREGRRNTFFLEYEVYLEGQGDLVSR